MRGMIKNGSIYSQDKIKRAATYGIVFCKIWEDEFKNMEKLSYDVMITLVGPLIDSDSQCNSYSNEDNKEGIRELFMDVTLHGIPDKLKVDEMKVWWA